MMSREVFRLISIPFPGKGVTRSFENYIKAFMYKIHANLSQNKVLMNLRDTFLPKLISGELCVPDAEKLLEGAL